MIYGLYLSAQGADVQSTRQDVISANLANASTTAFKRDLAVFQAHRPYDEENGISQAVPGDLNQSTGGISLAGVVTDYRNGSILPTGGTYDIALNGPGFFKVSDGRNEYLTRNGRLTRNAQGELVTQGSGLAVMSTGGAPITISAEAQEVEISSNGTVFQVGPDKTRSELGQIDLVLPRSLDSLVKLGDSLYRADGAVESAGDAVQVQQRSLESSGTEPVSEMVQLIEASRAFEANVNMIRFQDEALGRLLGAVARK